MRTLIKNLKKDIVLETIGLSTIIIFLGIIFTGIIFFDGVTTISAAMLFILFVAITGLTLAMIDNILNAQDEKKRIKEKRNLRKNEWRTSRDFGHGIEEE